MVCHGRRRGLCDKVRASAQSLVEGDGAGLRELLPPERVAAAVQAQGVKFIDCLFTPLVTLWAFLGQVLGPDRSCAAAVAKLLALLGARGAEGDELCEPDTGPYCKARKRLPEALLSRLARESGADLHRKYPAGALLGGRPVKVVDGTTVSMPDTPENQEQYPQPASQKPGLGFPLMRLVAVLSLNCAAVLEVAFGPYSGKGSGEPSLFRTLLDKLERGDVVLADRYSFAGALQTLEAFAPALRLARAADLPRLWEIVLRAVARHRVGNRPDRYEPRAVKRRAKPIALLTVPREQARKRLARGPAKKG